MMAGITSTPIPPPCRGLMTTSWHVTPDSVAWKFDTWSQKWIKLVVGWLEVPSVRFTWGHHVSLAVIWPRGKPRSIRTLSKRRVVKKSACPTVVLRILVLEYFVPGGSVSPDCWFVLLWLCAAIVFSASRDRDMTGKNRGRCHKTA